MGPPARPTESTIPILLPSPPNPCRLRATCPEAARLETCSFYTFGSFSPILQGPLSPFSPLSTDNTILLLTLHPSFQLATCHFQHFSVHHYRILNYSSIDVGDKVDDSVILHTSCLSQNGTQAPIGPQQRPYPSQHNQAIRCSHNHTRASFVSRFFVCFLVAKKGSTVHPTHTSTYTTHSDNTSSHASPTLVLQRLVPNLQVPGASSLLTQHGPFLLDNPASCESSLVSLRRIQVHTHHLLALTLPRLPHCSNTRIASPKYDSHQPCSGPFRLRLSHASVSTILCP